MKEIIRIAVQKSGRLNEDTVRLLRECGIDFQNSAGSKLLVSAAVNFPAEFLFLRDDDIPGCVDDGVADLGIVGLNVVREREARAQVVERLGYGKCRLSIAAPKGGVVRSVRDLAGRNVATAYPRILKAYLAEHKIAAQIHEISGSVEIAPSIGLAEAICDLVSSGSTLVANNLVEVERVMESEAVLIAGSGLAPTKRGLMEQLCFRIQAVRRAGHTKYILLNAPNDRLDRIFELLPACKSPTVLPLALEGWSSVHSVVEEDRFWEIIEKLKAAGAEGILVIPIEKLIA